MSNPTTGFTCINASGVSQDLSGIFQPLGGGTSTVSATGFIDICGNDLNTLFLPATAGNYIDFSTNFLVNELDLANIFAPYGSVPFTASNNSASAYAYKIVGNYMEIYFLENNSIFFNRNITGVQIVTVGGGGAGGQNPNTATDNGGGYGGGGGGGGYMSYLNSQELYAEQTCSIIVGEGGSAGQAGTSVTSTNSTGSGNGGTSSFTNSAISLSASGGNIGGNILSMNNNLTVLTSAQGGTGQGAGGNGANIYGPNYTDPTNGNSGTLVTLYSGNTFYVGGGGGGGGYYSSNNTSGGGLGGGGGTQYANAGTGYTNPIGTVYTANNNNPNGYDSLGGGGAGMYGNPSPCYGYPGGSGIVTLCFQWPQ